MNNQNKINKYGFIIATINGIFDSKVHIELITALSNIVTLIKENLTTTSWVGFYIYRPQNDDLILGPFCGKLACNQININNGVCGKAYRENNLIIVSDVNTIPYHIACDANTKSELVAPLLIKNKIYGVLDLDSHNLNNFDEIDKKYILSIIEILDNYYSISL